MCPRAKVELKNVSILCTRIACRYDPSVGGPVLDVDLETASGRTRGTVNERSLSYLYSAKYGSCIIVVERSKEALPGERPSLYNPSAKRSPPEGAQMGWVPVPTNLARNSNSDAFKLSISPRKAIDVRCNVLVPLLARLDCWPCGRALRAKISEPPTNVR